MQRRHFLSLSVSLGMMGSSLPSWAKNQAVRLQVGAIPGGGPDNVARALAQAMEAELRRSVVVENKPGAAGNIAASAVAQTGAAPNMLLRAYTSHAINPVLGTKQNFDSLNSFTPLSLVATSPLLLVCHPSMPVSNTRELISYAQKNPGKLGIAGAGLNSASHLAGGMFKTQAQLDIVSVPYKGAAPAVQDFLGCQVHLMLSNVATVRPFLHDKKLKATGISAPERMATCPGTAPIADALPGFDYRTWYGVLAPAGLKDDAAAQLEAAAVRAARSDLVQQRLAHEGLSPMGSTRQEFTHFISAEIKRWSAVSQATGLRAN